MSNEFDFGFSEVQAPYNAASQQARVWTESWALRELYCPACGTDKLSEFPNNKPVADFFCGDCDEEFELKAKNGPIGRTVPDGAYQTMIARLQSNTKPSLMLLRYDKATQSVRDVSIVPKQFFVPDLIKKRKPLAETARRAGWVGCDIRIEKVPTLGNIVLIKNQIARPKSEVVSQWNRTKGLRSKSFKQMGWIADVLNCVERVGRHEFSLSDMYEFENYLAELHPDNHNIKPKIRQQLQILRDEGIVVFKGRGQYQLVNC